MDEDEAAETPQRGGGGGSGGGGSLSGASARGEKRSGPAPTPGSLSTTRRIHIRLGYTVRCQL